MRSSNQTLQAGYASAFTRLLQRLCNEQRVILAIARAPRAPSLAVLLSLYPIHHALLMNGLRSQEGPHTLDAFDALRMLQIIVGGGHWALACPYTFEWSGT
ncbi:hypothetical protein D3C77_06410 [compost metagenome]